MPLQGAWFYCQAFFRRNHTLPKTIITLPYVLLIEGYKFILYSVQNKTTGTEQ
ncbi:hypothetical protein THOG11_70213 [Vibrio harveyi]|nr:hypothetical protein THOD03_60214 [Vibrio harveyi]CAH1587315.1 hypothetical protein THOG11_70213 [Vibrio harveyi]